MKILITGATGFIGSALCERLVKDGHEIIVLSRNAEKANKFYQDRPAVFKNSVTAFKWDGKNPGEWKDKIEGVYGIINLAGENIASGRWTREKKQLILESRIDAGKFIVEAIRKMDKKPRVLIQASGIGYYGAREDSLDESSSPGEGYLASVAQKWEDSSKEAENFGVRRLVIRTGVVLEKNGGALPRFLPPFLFFLGGHLGTGEQWFSWIHLADEVEAIYFLLKREDLNGVFNLTAPESVKMRDFCLKLGKILNRPSWLSVPGFVLNLMLGEMAKEIILSGQRVAPKRLLEAGYKFLYPALENALEGIFYAIPT